MSTTSGDRGGIARTVGQEHAVGLEREDLGRRRCDAGTTSTVRDAGEVAQDRGLDAEVEGDDAPVGRVADAGRRSTGGDLR